MIFGRHKKNLPAGKKNEPVHVNVIPMIDMMMVCNVFLLMQNAVASFAAFQSPDLIIPKSQSEEELGYDTEIAVTAQAVYLQGKLVEPNFAEYEEKDIPELAGLSDALKRTKEELIAKGKGPEPGDPTSAPGAGFPAVIRADKRLPFKLLQKVMYTCNINGFDKMEFAVIKDELNERVDGPVPGSGG